MRAKLGLFISAQPGAQGPYSKALAPIPLGYPSGKERYKFSFESFGQPINIWLLLRKGRGSRSTFFVSLYRDRESKCEYVKCKTTLVGRPVLRAGGSRKQGDGMSELQHFPISPNRPTDASLRSLKKNVTG